MNVPRNPKLSECHFLFDQSRTHEVLPDLEAE